MCNRCCNNCAYCGHDWSTDAMWCDNENENGEWVEQESENYWAPDNDYCTLYEEARY